MAFLHLETSLHRIHQSRFLRRPEGTHKQLIQVAFFDAQDAQNEFLWLFDTLKQRFIDFKMSIFKMSRRLIMSCQVH
jgi:hypothetical protein